MREETRRRRVITGPVVLVLSGMLAGCGLSIPSDPDGTLDTVRGGELRVGLSPDGELVELNDDDDPEGSVVDLV